MSKRLNISVRVSEDEKALLERVRIFLGCRSLDATFRKLLADKAREL